MSAFRVGQKVVCIDASPGKYAYLNVAYAVLKYDITEGAVYTISSLGVFPIGEIPTIKLVGIMDRASIDYGYGADRFRPVHTLESDMEIFKAIPIPTEVEA